ncbi:MAG TPA: IclR family transcriptional regulator [bacterium]|jgi:DNA-binding IclR family transcriptional regulator|nr:IclR family transcriptional regulator [bacterium]
MKLKPADVRRSRRAAETGKRRYVVTAVGRALGILENVGGDIRGTGITELSRRLGLGKSTVHRLCATLEHHGYLVRDPGTGRYRLSLRVFHIGSHALDALDLPARAMPALEALGAVTEETVHLAVLDGAEAIFIGKVESPRPLRLYSQVGRRCPAHCTAVGKVLLAYAGAGQRALVAARPLKRYTSKTITSTAALERELEEVRRRGYATDEEEFEDGIRCVAAPVRDYRGRVVAALSVSVPAARLPRARAASLVEQVLDTARRVSEALGHRTAPDRGREAPA